MYINAKIGITGGDPHVEEFDVENMKTAEEEVQAVIDKFNSTLRLWERERFLVKILGKVVIKDTEHFYRRSYKFSQLVKANAFIDAWCKKNEKKVVRAVRDIYNPGGVEKMKKSIRESPLAENFTELLKYEEKK